MPSPTSETKRLASFDVVVVPFPYSDRFAQKRRPAVVVSAPEVHRAGFVWLAMVTTTRAPALPGDTEIADVASAGLHQPCIVRPIKIACVEPTRILRRIGRLDTGAAQAIAAALARFVGQPPRW